MLRLWAIILLLLAPIATGQQQPSGSVLHSEVLHAGQLQEQGHSKEAKAAYEAFLPRLRAGGSDDDLGATLNALANIKNAEGDYAGSLQLSTEAGQHFSRAKNAAGEARAHNNSGVSNIYLGAYPSAHEHFREALRLASAAGDSKLKVQILNNDASVYLYQGRYYDSQRVYETAAQVLESHGAEPWYGYWRQITDLNLATLYQRIGQEQRAIDVYRQIQSAPQKLEPEDKAQLLANLGTLYRHIGDPYKAIEAYCAAQTLFAQQKNADGELGALKNIGIAQALDLGRLNAAETTFDAALALAKKTANKREQTQALLYRAEARFRRRNLTGANSDAGQALDLAKSAGATEEQWKALYALGRIALAENNEAQAEKRFGEALDVIEASRAKLQLSALRSEFLADKRDAYDALTALMLKHNDAEQVFALLERSRARTLQDKLQPSSALHSIGDVQKKLPADSVLLEFWTNGSNVALVWASPTDKGVERFQLSSEQKTLLERLQRSPSSFFGGDWQSAARKLSALIPDVRLLQNAKHVIIVPDGELALIPFEVLDRESDRRMVIEQADVTYLPAASLLFREALHPQAWGWPWQKELAAFADPIVEGTSSADPDRSGLAPLPASRQEAEAIAHEARARSLVFLAAADRKTAFASNAAAAPLLHLATHAIADSDRTDRSRLLFSPPAEGNESDYLMLKEVYDLDLRNVRLATLSACDTERGRLVRGEGVQAFSRAFLSAGSRATVTTLWKVSDQATAEFMQQFYFYLLRKGESPAEALRSAKLAFIRSNTALGEPRYWAAFVLNGDGQQRIPRYVSWAELLATIIGSAILIAIVAWVLNRRRQGAVVVAATGATTPAVSSAKTPNI